MQINCFSFSMGTDNISGVSHIHVLDDRISMQRSKSIAQVPWRHNPVPVLIGNNVGRTSHYCKYSVPGTGRESWWFRWSSSIVFFFLFQILFVESVLMNSNESYLTTKKEKNLKQAWAWYGQYVFGFLILLLVVQVGKNLVGAPRPHFFDTCKPDKAVNCTSGWVGSNGRRQHDLSQLSFFFRVPTICIRIAPTTVSFVLFFRHYVEYKCTNKNLTAWDLTDSVRSFPSGHAALGVYTAVFMSVSN